MVGAATAQDELRSLLQFKSNPFRLIYTYQFVKIVIILIARSEKLGKPAFHNFQACLALLQVTKPDSAALPHRQRYTDRANNLTKIMFLVTV